MIRKPDDINEERISERYDRGKRRSDNPDEQRIISDFEEIDRLLFTLPVRPIDKSPLVRRMQAIAGTPSSHKKFWENWSAIWRKPAFAAVLIALVGFIAWFAPRPSYNNDFIVSASYKDDTAAAVKPLPNDMLKQFQKGELVEIPEAETAVLHLSDGSTVCCDPRTLLAFDYNGKRRIKLQSGYILVQAAHIPSSTLYVETPIATVEVTGTVFWVHVKKQK